MIFEKEKSGVRHLKMQDWSLTLTPAKNEKGAKGFIAQYYENGKEELRFVVDFEYDAMLCKEKTEKNDAILYKIIAFLDVFKRMDELEEFEKNLK